MLSGPSGSPPLSVFALAEARKNVGKLLCDVEWSLMALKPIIFPFGFRLARYNCCLLPGGLANGFSNPMEFEEIMRLLSTCWCW